MTNFTDYSVLQITSGPLKGEKVVLEDGWWWPVYNETFSLPDDPKNATPTNPAISDLSFEVLAWGHPLKPHLRWNPELKVFE